MLKCYFRIFVLAGGAFFLGSLAADMNMYEGWGSVLSGLVTAGLFGSAAAASIGTLHISRARAVAGDRAKGDIYSLYQIRDVPLSVPYDRAFHAVAHYLGEVAKYNIVGSDQVAGLIEARISSGPLGFSGSRLSASVRREGENSVVTLRTAPALWPGLADYGRNLKAALDAEAYLTSAGRA